MARLVFHLLYYNLAVLLCSVQSQRIIYLTPNAESTSVRECSSMQEPCYTLTSLTTMSLVEDNVSDITIILLPGVHTYRGTKDGVIKIVNTTTVELRAKDLKLGASTVNCNATKHNIGFAFSNVSNLTIYGITFESCGVRQMGVMDYFTLFISCSDNVMIENLSIKNGTGIALYIENLGQMLVLNNTTFHYNQVNLYIFNTHSENKTFVKNKTLTIENLQSFSGYYVSKSNHIFPGVTNPGITMVLNQTLGYTEVSLTNITIHVLPRDIFSSGFCDIYHNMHTTIIHINGLECNTQYFESVHYSLYGYRRIPGLIIEPRNFSQVDKSFGSITVNNVYLNNSRMQIGPLWRSNVNFKLIMTNISIRYAQDPLTIVNIGHVTLHNVSIEDSDGALCITKCRHLSIQGQLTLQRNRGQLLFFYIRSVIFHANSSLLLNASQQSFPYPEDWPFYIVGTVIQVNNFSTVVITNNVGRKCGGMVLEKSNVLFEGESTWLFSNNSGQRGGALLFQKKSKLVASGMAVLIFEDNRARREGGAIFVVDADYITKGVYLGDDTYETFTVGKTLSFSFINNRAGQAGSAIYGGWIHQSQSAFNFEGQQDTDLSVVSSDPIKLCPCSKSLPTCTRSVHSVELIPGETFSIEIVAVGQMYGVVPSRVSANYLGQTTAKLGRLQYTQNVGSQCTNLEYTVQSNDKMETLKLTVASTINFIALQHDKNIDTDISISITLKNCSLGFYLDTNLKKCQCQQILLTHGITCNLTTFKILRESPKWINATFSHLALSQNSGVIVHDHCPFDYCKQTKGYSELNLTSPDEQCAFKRSGILCGACQSGYSRVLGTSRCKHCEKYWLVVIIPLMALAGVALVVGLMILNITVSIGTINGLIFYANIVRANSAIFFPYQTSHSFLSTFIAWLNLDLGIESCFYDNFDGLSVTWLQFLFPLYIWFIVIVIIVASHYSTRVSKLCGSNAVQVLATLFLLSYAKLLRIIITIFSSTELVYPNGHRRWVWLYDGNVEYLKGKHIYLFVVAFLLLTVISLPYTAMLLFVQLLQKLPNYKIFSWVVKLHPLFDAYTGPYKIKHRYWTGLLLFVRACLFLVFSLNLLGDPMVNLLAISLTALVLCGYNSIIRGVYRQWWLNLIEIIFFLNLGMLSSVAHYQIASGGSLTPITYTSTGTALLIFVAIVIYHIKVRLTPIRWVSYTQSKIRNLVKLKSKKNTKNITLEENRFVTSSSVDLRELLIDD